MRLPKTLINFCKEHDLDTVAVRAIYTYLVKEMGMRGLEAVGEVKRLFRNGFFNTFKNLPF